MRSNTVNRLLSLFVLALGLSGCGDPIRDEMPLDQRAIDGAESVLGLQMTDAERDLMRDDLVEQRASYADLRRQVPDNTLRPALRFDPAINQGGRPAVAAAAYLTDRAPRWADPGPVSRPADLHDLAFATVGELSVLIHSRQVSSVELTELALTRLQEHDPDLHCVITLLPDRALARAQELDKMLARGEDLGPLHGIPFGAKDLLALAGHKTTWGAAPYRDQIIDETATVLTRLEEAGAVLVAKLTLGALAWGDVWFGGMTRNPWRLEQGSSGSSAGSAAAVSAGLVPFAIGTETWGSIVSPCTRCGVSGLRPSFGRVSRFGAMALSWSMDKIGPIARTAEDCALVFGALQGFDPGDPTTVDLPFPYDADLDVTALRVGYLADAFAAGGPDSALGAAALAALRTAGLDLRPVTLPLDELGVDIYDLSIILSAEAAAAFQDLTFSGRDDELVRQMRFAWPNVFRAAQFIPAVEYIQANRHRTRLMALLDDVFGEIDVLITPPFDASLLVTNLTGHPEVVVPAGFLEPDQPHSICFIGRLYDEATVLATAGFYQRITDWHRRHPEGF